MILNTLFVAFLISSVCPSFEVNNRTSFQEYLDYVNENIAYTMKYVLPEDNSKLLQTDDPKSHEYGTFDFIIIGGGSAGTLLAKRLTEVSRWKILILEAGDKETAFTDIPFMNFFTRNSEYNWGYKTVPQKNSCLGMVNHSCVYPIGKGLGGSGIIGDMVYARGNRKDYDNWEKMGLKEWSFDALLPYFKKTESIKISNYDKGYHGTDGPLYVNYTYPNVLNYEQYLESSKLCGLKSIDINGEHQVGISKFPWTIDSNRRLTGGNTFILPLMDKNNNLTVSLKSFVTKILISNNRAIGVKFIKDKKRYIAYSNKEVILSAGAVNSPQILMLSGIGPQKHLKELGIPLIKNLPVGKYLTDHPVFVGLYVRTNQTVPPLDIAKNLKRWFDGEAPFTTVLNAENIAFINTKKPGQEPPNIETLTANPPSSVPPGSFYNLNPEYTEVFKKLNPSTDFLIYTILIEPKSRGNIRLKSKNPADFPLINPAYYTDPKFEDIQNMYEGIKFVYDVVKQPPLQSIGAKIISESPSCEHLRKSELDKDYWYCAIKYLASTLYHPTSTTRMGMDPKTSVVNERLQVHGIRDLRVIDAGVMPTIVRGHTLAAVFMIAERGAMIIKEEYKAF